MTNLDFLLTRQSAAALGAPAPTTEEIQTLIRAAATVPDHGKLRPYRFIVIGESAKPAFGEALMQVVDVARGGITEELKEKFRKRAYVAPVQIAVIYSPKSDEKIPHWEQLVCASCTGYAIILAATAMGLGAHWRSSSLMEGAAITELFAMKEGEKFLGWVNVGQIVAAPVKERDQTGMTELATHL